MSVGIGWDIGIKNLAYCIIEPQCNINIAVETLETLSPSTSNEYITLLGMNFKIKFWNDISLVSQIERNLQVGGEISHINNILKCCCNKKPIKSKPNDIIKCENTAAYCDTVLYSDGTYKGYCKIHYKSYIKDNALTISKLPDINAKMCYYDNCNTKSHKVLKSHIYTGYCKKHITEMIHQKTYSANDFLNINRAKTTSKINIAQLGQALFQELDKIKEHILIPDVILLENQPVLKNPTMKSMQMFLFSYYLIRNMDISRVSSSSSNALEEIETLETLETLDTLDTVEKIEKVEAQHQNHPLCYTASKKLDLIKFLPDDEQQRITSIIDNVKNNYQKNKKLAILIVEYLLKNNSKWLSFFNTHTKQDDLSDSLLMTLHYYMRSSLIKLSSASSASSKKKKKVLDINKLVDLDLDLE